MKTPYYIVGIGLLLGGCNAFSPVDSPSGDEQLLSAARACFDRGDIECAKDNYGKMTTNTDLAASETAFAILDQEGISMGTFMAAFGNGQGGSGLNNLINELAKHSNAPSAAKRANIFSAYQKVGQIQNKELRGLTRFVTAVSLAAEVLAEDAGADGTFTKDDLASNASACETAGSGCALSADCLKSGSKLSYAASVNLDSSTSLSGSPNLGMINGAMNAINTAMSQELGAGGSFSSGTADFANDLAGIPGTDNAFEACFRQQLIIQGAGGK